MKKKLIIILCILCLVAGCGKAPKLANGKEAVVSFEKDETINISVDDLYNVLKEDYALSILVDMIDKNILLKEYPKIEKEAEDSAKEQIKDIKKYYVDKDGNYDENALIQALNQYYGINSVDKFEEMLIISYYRNKAIKDYAKTLITEKQIEEYYKDEVYGDISAKHILIAVNAKEGMKDDEIKKLENEAKKKAENIIKELDKGTSFDELAKKHSDDKSNSEKGGDLGYFGTGQMAAEFEKAAFALKLNAYTKEPVKTKFGYHIILKTGEKDKPALKDKKDEIIETLSEQMITMDKTISVNALVELRKEYGFKIEDSELNKKYSTYVSNQLLSYRTQDK